jgi:hypothetical protein
MCSIADFSKPTSTENPPYLSTSTPAVWNTHILADVFQVQQKSNMAIITLTCLSFTWRNFNFLYFNQNDDVL